MIEYKTETVEIQQTSVEYMICDLCGRKKEHTDDWADRTYDVKDTTVSLEDGSSYPEGGNVEITSFDICPDCFRDKLIPWMESQGAKPTVKERDW